MKLALIQLEPKLMAVEENLGNALAAMAKVEADVYLLPELYASGYTFVAGKELEQVAEGATEGASLTAFGEFARERGAYVCYGFAERGDGGFYNSANLVGPMGLAGTYRKIHLFGRETLFFRRGEKAAPVFELPGVGRVGMMICFDWTFPEVARSLALKGAEVLLHPSNLVLPHCPQAMITRSLENRVFSATCDRVGEERNGKVLHRFIGSSQVVSPRGEVLVRLGREAEESAVVEIRVEEARNKGIGEYNDVVEDRRPALYV